MRISDNVSGLMADDFKIAVLANQVPNWEYQRSWNEHASVAQTQEEMSNIASGIRVLPTTPTVVSIVSTSAEDGAGTATGITAVRVYYLDSNFDEKRETVTLTGTTPATTTGTAMRLKRVEAETAGSTGAAVGTITVSINGNPQSRILPTQNETRESGISVPNNHTAVIDSFTFVTGRSASVDVDIAIEVRRWAGTAYNYEPWITVSSFQVYQSAQEFTNAGALALPERADVRVLATASGASAPALFTEIRTFFINDAPGARFSDQ